jgi:hypothetical protein
MTEKSDGEVQDPRDEARLLRRLRPLRDIGDADITPPAVVPPVGARCEKCASAMVSSMPYFSAGSGLAFRPIANDVRCQRCGHIGPVDFA